MPQPIVRNGWTIEELAAFFRELGYRAEIQHVDGGTEVIHTVIGGWKTTALPSRFGKQPTYGLLGLLFTASGYKLSLEKANVWNRQALFAHISLLDDGRILYGGETILIGATEQTLAHFIGFFEAGATNLRKFLR